MSDQITYDDKTDLIVDTTIDNIFKVTASDMNEIKDVVNSHADDIDEANNNITDLNNNKLDANAVQNEASTDTDKTYSANYLNDKLVSVGTTAPTDGRRVWFEESKNVLVPNFTDGYTATKTGITLTYNNGTYRVQGTATSDYFFIIADQNQKDLRAKLLSGKYYLSGAPSGSSNSTYWLQIYGISATGTSAVRTFEEGLRINNFVNEAQNFNISIFVKANQTIDVLFKPQLEEGEITSFEPYIEPSINVDGEEWYNPNNVEKYSTNETKIGTWIDGRNLYRKVITITSINTNANVTEVSISLANLNEIVNIGGSVKTSSGQYKPVTTYYMDSTGIVQRYGFCVYAITSSLMTLSYGDWWKGGAFNGCKVIIEYTKTTD